MKRVGTLGLRESDMKLYLVVSLNFIIYKLNYTAALHSMRWEEGRRVEGRWPALDILVHLHLLLCAANSS